MKKRTITLGVALFTIMGLQAQNNTDIKKETVIRKVTTTDKYNKTIKIIEKVDNEVDVLNVKENNTINQNVSKITNKTDANNVIVDETIVDTQRQMEDAKADAEAKAKIQNNIKRELEKSKINQANQENLKKAKYDVNIKMLELERAERKAVLSKKIGQSAEQAKKKSVEVKNAQKAYNEALEKATKAEMLMEKMKPSY